MTDTTRTYTPSERPVVSPQDWMQELTNQCLRLTDQVRLLTERVEKLEKAKACDSPAKPYRYSIAYGPSDAVPGGLNDCEPKETYITKDKDGCSTFGKSSRLVSPQTLGQAATGGAVWEDTKGEQAWRKCDRPPGM